jgi:hypothetical protein
MRNPFQKPEVTAAQIRAANRGQRVPARVAQAAAQQAGVRRKSLAAQSAAWKKQQAAAAKTKAKQQGKKK